MYSESLYARKRWFLNYNSEDYWVLQDHYYYGILNTDQGKWCFGILTEHVEFKDFEEISTLFISPDVILPKAYKKNQVFTR